MERELLGIDYKINQFMWMQMIIRSGPLRNHKQLLRDGRNDDGPTGLIPTQDSDSHQAVYQLVLVIKPV